mmetsp:Transcript_23158/g.36838  ORF Transcript_23158/g.36838 Transcript_23158/m.36838 type:complete len:222 (-) Transcript_23158:2312-2977(-)
MVTMSLESSNYILYAMQLSDLYHVLIVNAQIRKCSTCLLLYPSVLNVRAHCGDNHPVSTQTPYLNLIAVVVREIRASEACKVLNSCFIRPRIHCINNHLDCPRTENHLAINLLHCEITQRTQAISLNTWVFCVSAKACQDCFNTSTTCHLFTVVFVQSQIRYGCATLFANLWMSSMVFNTYDNEFDTTFYTNSRSAWCVLRHVRERTATLSLHTCIRLEGA